MTDRQRIKWNALTARLDKELQISIDIFDEENPWILDPTIPYEPISRTDEQIVRKMENEATISKIIKSLHQIVPPSEAKLLLDKGLKKSYNIDRLKTGDL